MEKIKAGVVGVGSMGQHHARNYFEMPGVELVGVCDVSEEQAKKIASQYNCKYYTNYHDLIKEVDVISIVTPSQFHLQPTLDFLNGSTHVLVEKPIALNLEDADKMIEAAEKNNKLLMVGHIGRFNPVMREVKKVLNDSKPLQIETHRYGPFFERVKETDIVLDLVIHDIDNIRYLTGSEPKNISAVGGKVHSNNVDFCSAVLIMQNGSIATLNASRATQRKIRSMWISCQDKFIDLSYISQDIDVYHKSSPTFLPKNGEVLYKQDNIIEKVTVYKKEPLKIELTHFIKCVNGEEKPEVDGKSARRNLEIALNILDKINKN